MVVLRDLFNPKMYSFLKRYIPYQISKDLIYKNLFLSKFISLKDITFLFGPTLVSIYKIKSKIARWSFSYKTRKDLVSLGFACFDFNILGRKEKKWWKYRRNRNKSKSFDSTSLINKLKITNKFIRIRKKYFKYCKIFFKYTGSNFFITITNLFGDVFLSYSAGVFHKLRTRKEKTTIFIAKELGELLGLRLSRLLSKQFIFIPYLNHKKIKSFLRYFYSGIKTTGTYFFNKMYPKRKVIRNGIRLRKPTRK